MTLFGCLFALGTFFLLEHTRTPRLLPTKPSLAFSLRGTHLGSLWEERYTGYVLHTLHSLSYSVCTVDSGATFKCTLPHPYKAEPQMPFGPLLCVWNMEAVITQEASGIAWQCMLGLLSMTKPHFQTSPLLYDSEKG